MNTNNHHFLIDKFEAILLISLNIIWPIIMIKTIVA